jgi:hypothetical protein
MQMLVSSASCEIADRARWPASRHRLDRLRHLVDDLAGLLLVDDQRRRQLDVAAAAPSRF